MLSRGTMKLTFKLREIYQAFLMIKTKTCKNTCDKFHCNIKNYFNFTKTLSQINSVVPEKSLHLGFT